MGERRAQESLNEERRLAISRPPSLSQPYPWLVIFDGDNDSRQTFYSISQNRYYVRYIPEMQNKFIVSSQQGWLFLEDWNYEDCYLLNMFTMEKLQLPPLDGLGPFHNSVLSSSTKIDESCRILVIMGNLHKFRSCYLGDSEFVEGRFTTCDIAAVLNYEGKLYALTYMSYDLLVADFADPELHFTPVIKGDEPSFQSFNITDDTKLYLVESCGEVLLIYTNCLDHDGLDIQIYKADMDRQVWVEVKCLGDRALFLDFYKGLSSSPASEFGLRGNCVYYVNDAGDRNLYVYDLEDGSATMFLPCPIVSNEDSYLYWAM